MKGVLLMEKLKKINLKVKAQQRCRILGGMGLMIVGLYLICDYYEHFGWTECQRFIHQYYPEEYDAITVKVIEECNKH